MIIFAIKFNKIYVLILLVFLLSIGCASANEMKDSNVTTISDESPIEIMEDSDYFDNDTFEEYNVLRVSSQDTFQSSDDVLRVSSQDTLQSSDDVIIVNNWEELQYYCAQTDKNYNLKLKENTNFYPSNPNNGGISQIKIKNNVKIIGSEGSYIGDNSSNARRIEFVAFLVEDNSLYGSLNFENVTFKYIYSVYTNAAGSGTRDGIFIQMGGIRNNLFKNCIFQDILSQYGHATIVYLKKGSATLDNCSFINCTSGYGAVSVYDPNSVKSTDMVVRNCYFENNYATTEPGCINNCGKLTVYNTTFVKNRSFWWAGAIHTHAGGNTTIYDSQFIDNVAGWNGGALYTYAYLQIYNSVFIGNNCTTDNGGGAIGACSYQTDPHIYIEHCLFKDNSNNCWTPDDLSDGTGRGGAISLMDAGSIEVRDTTFVANSASRGTAICAFDVATYGSPDIIIVNNSFINHTRVGDVLEVHVNGTILDVSNNYYYGNSVVFSNLTLTKLSEDKEFATLQVNASLSKPQYYDSDVLDKTLYDVYINNKYVKTVNSSIFTVDFGDLDICDVYVIPTISNRKSNEVTIASTREYIFVSKDQGNDNNSGVSREAPVNTIKRALELASNCQNIILLDGDFSEYNLQIGYDVTIKGEGNATLTGVTSFISNSNFNLKNLRINNLNSDIFINQIKNRLFISHCIFTNNDDVLVNNSGFTSISDSILLNSSQIITGDVNNINLDYNWWGNTRPSLNINKFITLNITSTVDCLENNHKAKVNVNFYTNENQLYSNLPIIDLNIIPINGITTANTIKSNSQIIYTLTAFEDGTLTINYNDFTSTKSFEFLKSNPNLSLTTEDVMVGEDVVIKVNLPNDCEGNLTVNVGNISKTNNVNIPVFIFSYLKAGTYDINITYSGDNKYASKNLTDNVNVDKYASTTMLNISEVNVGEEVILTITTTDTSTGTIALSINNSTQTLTLNNSKASYTIKNIKRGDYLISAHYNGDEKYLASSDSRFIEVDNLNATMKITTQNIVYGDTEVIKVNLNDDATGEVSVTVDGVTNTSKVINGKAEISFSNLNAGFKNITVFYSGDDTYFNFTESSNFTIDKTDLIFNISSIDIKIGQIAEITIQVTPRTSGTFTIGSDILTIPMSGLVTYGIADLEIGNYTYTAVYNGNNYKTISNSTSFKVSEYPIPQVPNNGLNPQNTQKSGYKTDANGNIEFIIPFNETVSGDLVIDSLGNLYITSSSGVYCFNQTGRLWYWSSNTFEGNLSGIAISRDVIIAPKSGDTLYFINQTSGERYGGSNIYQGSSLFAPVVDSNANLYIVSEYQYSSEDYKLVFVPYSLWENGGDPTLVTIGNTKPLCAPTLNDEVIIIISENRLRLINAKTLETISIKSGNFQGVRPVIGEGNIVYAILSDSIVAYNGNGVQAWKTKVTGGAGTTLALDNEQGLYHVNAKGILYKYDLVDGSQSKFSDLKVTSGILIDANSNLYFASGDVFYAMDVDGNILWKSNIASKVIGNPVMDKEGVIYITTEKGIVGLGYAPLQSPKINIATDDVFYGETATVTVTADNQILNTLTITVNNETFTESVNSQGVITKTFSGLKTGCYSIEVTYGGDLRFASQTVSSDFTVKKLNPNVSVNVENISYGENLVFNVNAASDTTGEINLLFNNESISKDISQKVFTFSNLDAGSYTYTFTYLGDDKYSNATVEGKVSISKLNTTLSVKSSDINVGDVEIIKVSMPENTNGNVSLSINNKIYSTAIINGTGNIAIENLTSGIYEVTLKFTGINFNDCESSTNFTVSKVKLDKSVLTITNGVVYAISLPLDAAGTLKVSLNNNMNYTKEIVNGVGQIVLSELAPGNYTTSVSYSGDTKYEGITFDDTFISIDKLFSDVSVSARDINVGEPAVINVTLTPIKTGSVVVNVNNKNYTVEIKNSTGSLPVLNLTSGSYSVVVSYAGDDSYRSCKNTTSFNVLKVILPVTNETISIPESDSTEYSISLPGDASGTLTVTVDGVNHTQSLINGKATVNIPDLTPGNHNITVIYSGDSKYSSILKSSIVDVPKFDSQLSVNVSDINVGETAVITIEITSKATGNVTITLDNKEYTETINNAIVSFQVDGLSVGTYAVGVKYYGDDNFNGCENTTSFNVFKVNVPVTNETITIPESDSTEYSISLPGDASGTLTVTVDGVNHTQSLINGKATVNIPELTPGNHNITVTYSGDSKYSPIVKSSVVTKEAPAPVIKLTGSNLSMLYSSGTYYKVRLTSDGQPLAGKTVKITINGNIYSRTTDKNGYASLKISLPPKAYTVKATYGSISLTKKVTVKSIITAKNVNAKKSAKTVKIKVTLKKVNNKYLKNKVVTLKFNKKTFKVKTNKKGVATFTIKNSVYKKLKANKKYTYQVIYGKDKVKKTIKFK